jgi:cytidylate kinase
MKAVFNTSMMRFIIKNLPQSLIYLAKRKEVRLENIDSRVNNAYDQVMNNRSRRLMFHNMGDINGKL